MCRWFYSLFFNITSAPFYSEQEQLMELDHLREKELHDALISLGITGSSQVFQKRQEYYQKAQQLFKKKGQKL
ncbi:hypothetical protein EFM1CSP_19850, partial [Enterococcus faecium]